MCPATMDYAKSPGHNASATGTISDPVKLSWNQFLNSNIGQWLLTFVRAIFNFMVAKWFLMGIAVAVGCAAALPELGKTGGWLRSEYSIKQFGVALMFLFYGMSLNTRCLVQASGRLHCHVLAQGICFGLTPFIGWGVSCLLRLTPVSQLLIDGLVIASCMPTTVAGNVLYTKEVGGNEAMALINAVIGNTAGVVISPTLLKLYLGGSSQAPLQAVFLSLGLTVLIPLTVGQMLLHLQPQLVNWLQSKIRFDHLGLFMILLLVWSSFCNVFAQKIKIDTVSIATIIFLDMALYLSFMALCMSLAYVRPLMRLLGLKRSDVIAIMFVGSTKTVALGFPLVSAVYGGSPHTAILVTPLLIYQAEQNFIGGLLLRPLRRWREKEEEDILPVTLEEPKHLQPEDVKVSQLAVENPTEVKDPLELVVPLDVVAHVHSERKTAAKAVPDETPPVNADQDVAVQPDDGHVVADIDWMEQGDVVLLATTEVRSDMVAGLSTSPGGPFPGRQSTDGVGPPYESTCWDGGMVYCWARQP